MQSFQGRQGLQNRIRTPWLFVRGPVEMLNVLDRRTLLGLDRMALADHRFLDIDVDVHVQVANGHHIVDQQWKLRSDLKGPYRIQESLP